MCFICDPNASQAVQKLWVGNGVESDAEVKGDEFVQ